MYTVDAACDCVSEKKLSLGKFSPTRKKVHTKLVTWESLSLLVLYSSFYTYRTNERNKGTALSVCHSYTDFPPVCIQISVIIFHFYFYE